jgi:hypothetical protein
MAMSDPYGGQPGWQQPPSSPPAQGAGYPGATPSSYPQSQPYPPSQPYPQAQPYAPAQPYPQGYPTAQPYPVAGYAAGPAAPVQRSGALGTIALLIMVLATAGSVIGVAMMADVINQVALAGGSSSYDEQMLQQKLGFPGLIVNVAGLIGFATWVVAIVATATNRGRVAGIIGIILGVLAPVGVWSYFFLALYQTIQYLQR